MAYYDMWGNRYEKVSSGGGILGLLLIVGFIWLVSGDITSSNTPKDNKVIKSINLSNREKTKQIQRILIKNGYKLKADGVFGKKTISAAKKFTGLNSADLNTLYIAVKNKADGKKN